MPGALFLDRDGVVNVDRGYVYRPQDFTFIEGIFDTARLAVAHQFRLIVVTNQSGIARGYYTEDDFQILTAWMSKRFAAEGAKLTAVYQCPYHAEGHGHWRVPDHPDRKPNPGMLLRALRDYRLEANESLLLGDKESDVEAGRRAGLFAIARFAPQSPEVATGADCIVRNHPAAADWIAEMHSRIAR
jgi:D-glycero-D-manno-heptose 1,7-bisphosphate phosphatase